MAISCGERSSTNGTMRSPGMHRKISAQKGHSSGRRGSLKPESGADATSRPTNSSPCSSQLRRQVDAVGPAYPALGTAGGSRATRACHRQTHARDTAPPDSRRRTLATRRCPWGFAGVAPSMLNGPSDMPNSERTLVARLDPLRCMQRMSASVLPSYMRSCPICVKDSRLGKIGQGGFGGKALGMRLETRGGEWRKTNDRRAAKFAIRARKPRAAAQRTHSHLILGLFYVKIASVSGNGMQ